jgi:hypothetical protein
MTNPTLERAIEAVANTASDDPGEENFEAVARAVLMAVRMQEFPAFTAMIDAILKEGET